MKKIRLYCHLIRQIQELKIKIPEKAKHIGIEKSIVPRLNCLYFYDGRKSFIENKTLNEKRYNKIERILRNEN